MVDATLVEKYCDTCLARGIWLYYYHRDPTKIQFIKTELIVWVYRRNISMRIILIFEYWYIELSLVKFEIPNKIHLEFQIRPFRPTQLLILLNINPVILSFNCAYSVYKYQY
jgi:hypothetical protein